MAAYITEEQISLSFLLSRYGGKERFLCVITYRMRGLKSSHCLSGRRPFLESPAHSFVFSADSQKERKPSADGWSENDGGVAMDGATIPRSTWTEMGDWISKYS
jgi:hypothetical protein